MTPSLQSLQPHLVNQNLESPSLSSRDVAQEMEGLFTTLLLKQMRQAGGEEGLFAGESSDTLGGMFDLYLGQHIAESGGLGLAASIETAIDQQM